MANSKSVQPVIKKHHYVRAMVAGTLGALAVTLVSATILLGWADNTLTNTNAYVATVGPVLSTTALQNFVADQVSSQLEQSQSLADLYAKLGPSDGTAVTPAAQKQVVESVIHDSVIQVMASPQLQSAWTDTNRQAHASLVAGLNSNASQIAIDITPFENALITALKQTKLSPIADKLDSGPSQKMVVGLAGAPLERIHRGYGWLRAAPWLVAVAAVVLVVLSVWISIHHGRTLRRMLLDMGVGSLLTAGVLAWSANVRVPGTTPAAVKVAGALTHVLLHGLQVALIVIGIVCLVAAGVSKWYGRKHPGSTWA